MSFWNSDNLGIQINHIREKWDQPVHRNPRLIRIWLCWPIPSNDGVFRIAQGFWNCGDIKNVSVIFV